MKIKNILDSASLFELDAASIGNTSTSKSHICLPYKGMLPDDLSTSTGAEICITLHPGLTVGILLTVEQNGKKHHHSIEATAGEINQILKPFFFDSTGHTRRDNGLDAYSLGFYQAQYISWKRLVLDAHGLDDLLFQLSPAAVSQIIEHIRHSETE